MKALALDLGRERTGVAVSDPTGTVVRPLAVIRRIDTPEGTAALHAVLAQEAPEVIVIGEPLLMSGVAGEQAHHARSFAGRLRTRVEARVVLSDERLSTTEAERLRRDGAAQAELDSVAACVILESWLRAQAGAA